VRFQYDQRMDKYPFDVYFRLTDSYKRWLEYISKAYLHCARDKYKIVYDLF